MSSVAVLQFPKLRHSLPPAYAPRLEHVQGNVAGAYPRPPRGTILHGSRSGQAYSTEQEYQATVRYVRNGAGGYGWSATIGDDRVCTHLDPGVWAWNARAASPNYLAVEFAQAVVGRLISDAQVRAFAWWWLNVARPHWPTLALHFPTHAELDGNETGAYDGKTDVFPVGDSRADELRARILAAIERLES